MQSFLVGCTVTLAFEESAPIQVRAGVPQESTLPITSLYKALYEVTSIAVIGVRMKLTIIVLQT